MLQMCPSLVLLKHNMYYTNRKKIGRQRHILSVTGNRFAFRCVDYIKVTEIKYIIVQKKKHTINQSLSHRRLAAHTLAVESKLPFPFPHSICSCTVTQACQQATGVCGIVWPDSRKLVQC